MRLAQLLSDAADSAPVPGLALAIVDGSGVLAQHVTGIANLDEEEPVTADHWWDLASLTKVLVTLPEVLDLLARSDRDLSDPLATWWPAAEDGLYGGATISQLLSYDAGAPKSCELWTIPAETRQDLVRAALWTPIERAPGSEALYSDIGMLLLGETVAAVNGTDLDKLAKVRGWCRYGPVAPPVVATERCSWRERLIVGEAHDENAAALGGVAGHAGAFGQIGDVAEAARAWLTGEAAPAGLTAEATSCHARSANGERFGLGFRLADSRMLGGHHPGEGSFGASGFAGTLLWVEPARGYAVVVLSNRIHPTRRPRQEFDTWCQALLDTLGSGRRR
jgi:CubicO group peptidase (beta-lactamase class C family)